MPLDFDWPLNKLWDGFLMPDRFDEDKCPDCKNGYSPYAQNLFDLWHGYLPFSPESTGSMPLRHDTPAVRACAEHNVSHAPDFYGTGEAAIVREGQRLAELWNRQWSHHLTQDDVNALVAAGRLKEFTHTWNPEDGWQAIEPRVVPTAEQINEWSLSSRGHDEINARVVIRNRCEHEGFHYTCPNCQGHSTLEKYTGQRAEAEAWEPTDPPEGEGWQLWETFSEGSPISPVFASVDGLAGWMSDPERGDQWVPAETARKFIDASGAPTGIGSPGRGYVSGVEAVGWHES
ncbi:hypothetical protein [Streptomyces sp. NRRL F-5053]|uniref:hypothetical protein n=1 Tax=Streptomyces sp. NRRL F-5053 TaxID=1463854 RepID=UPI0007C4E563|nr:hypothetical protein [Streptomyces sp. NRRL F-5053]